MTKLRFFGLMLLLGALLAGLAFAEGTEANERITNVATATYNDSTGDPQTTSSNPVTTIVQQVYRFTITPNGVSEAAPGQTETALPGAPVYFNYTVTNTGNGQDTIDLVSFNEAATDDGGTAFDDDGATLGDQSNFDLTGLTVYRDLGCDGSVAGDSIITNVTLDPDRTACIIVAGTIPGTATDGQFAAANIYGVSQGDTTVSEEDNWARAVANTAGNLTGNKVANPASGTPVAAGGTITYTVSGSNNGGSAAFGQSFTYTQSGSAGSYDGGSSTTVSGVVIADVLDTDVSYAGSLSGTAGGGTVVLLYSDDGGTTWHDEVEDLGDGPANGTNADVTAVAMFIQGTGAFFPQSANYSMSFNVTVDSGTSATASINNTATIGYDTDNDAGNGTATTTTNTTNNPVTANYSVAVGPHDEADTDALSGNASYTDPATATEWHVTLSGDYSDRDDTQTINATLSPVSTGDTVAFRHTVKNKGNATDSFVISASSAQGYTVRRFQSDGVSPLLGAVGPLAPGEELDIVIKVTVSGTTGDTVTVTATSSASGAANDISLDVIPTPVSRAVDLATNSVAGSGESGDNDPSNDDPANQTVAPSGTLIYPIELTNTGNQSDTYAISETLPAGWTVQYYTDPNCDGVRTDGALLTDPESTGSVAATPPNNSYCFVAEVTVPPTATNDSDPGTAGFQPYDIDFTVTSGADGAVSDTISTQATVQVAEVAFAPDQTATTSPDSVVTYTHTLSNDGNVAASVDIPAQSGTDFTYQYSTDDVTYFNSLSAVNVAAGSNQTIYVRVVVPDTANDGDSETVTVSAQVGGTTVDSVQDTTIVQAGDLDLSKTAVTCAVAAAPCAGGNIVNATGATAEPGEFLHYTVVASNIGSGNLTNVKVSDPLPTFTDFESVSGTSTAAGTVLYSVDGSAWSDTAPGTLSTGQTVYVAVDTNGDDTITPADELEASETITMTFVVRVQ